MKVTDLKLDEVIHCQTEKEANEICKLMHQVGLRWSSGDSYLQNTKYMVDVCYHISSGSYETYDYFKKLKNFKIYSANLFIRGEKINKLLQGVRDSNKQVKNNK